LLGTPIIKGFKAGYYDRCRKLTLVERDAFVEELNQFTSLGFGDISGNVAGKNSVKTIDEQTEEQFSSFMEILSK